MINLYMINKFSQLISTDSWSTRVISVIKHILTWFIHSLILRVLNSRRFTCKNQTPETFAPIPTVATSKNSWSCKKHNRERERFLEREREGQNIVGEICV